MKDLYQTPVMTNERLQYLISKYKQESSSDEEYAELDNWFHSLKYRNLDFKQWMEEAGGSDKMAAAMLEDFRNNYLRMEEGEDTEPSTIKVDWWRRIPVAACVAAAAVAAITLSVWLYYPSSRQSAATRDLSTYTNDIAPGKNTATLTLANGKTINLSEAKTGVVIDASKITYNDNTVITGNNPSSQTSPSSRIEGRDLSPGGKDPSVVGMTSVSTPRGGTYEVLLPDGTHVWLNAASSIKFPSKFTGSQRVVEITGEAYFEVAKDAKRKFIVRSSGQEVTVLGTHFNINSYEATVRTTLLEGSVQVTPLQQPAKKTVIKPGQQAVVSKNLLEILPVDVEVATAWKNGNFLFRNERLESIMKRLAYWYDVEVIYLYDKRDLKYTGVIGRKRNLSSILDLLGATGNVKFKIEGRKVYVFD